MRKRRKFSILLILLLSLFLFDLFLFRPSGIYSYTKSESHNFVIGMSKEQAFEKIESSAIAISGVRTREPFHDQNLYRIKRFEFTKELDISNYWVLYESASIGYLLIFRNGELIRIMAHVRRFGELETGISMFSSSYPRKTADGLVEDKDLFDGLSANQMDELILQQREWTRVFLN
jgi:hypothetical protein